jgi:hypothetical protein
MSNIMAKMLLDISIRLRSILDHIMEDTRLHRDDIRPEKEEQLRSLKWMSDIRISTLACLISVSIPSKYIGIIELLFHDDFPASSHISSHVIYNLTDELF